MTKNNITIMAMSKTKNVVIDDQNAKREEHERRVRDLYRMSIETVRDLSQALSKATKEVQGERSIGEAVTDCPLYCEMLPLELSIGNLWLWREKHSDKYRKMCMGELLKELYLRMQMFYKYGYVDNGNLSGIAWSIDKDGVFCLELRDCMVNMEHLFQEESQDRPATLFAIGLNLPLLKSEDPEDEGSHLYGEYVEFVSFCCELRDEKEIRDIYPTDTYINEQAVRNILGSLDLINEMNNKNK